MNDKVIFLSLGLLICLLTVTLLSSVDAALWTNWEPATCLSNGCFCEQIASNQPLRQPINTLSSLAFVLAGSAILVLDSKLRATQPSARLKLGQVLLLVASTMCIGVGSAFFHASLTLVGQFLDVFGMYMLATFILTYALGRICHWSNRSSLVLYLSVVTGLGTLLFLWPESRRFVFAIVLGLSIVSEIAYQILRRPHLQIRYWYGSLIVLISAYVIWILDNLRVLCDPQSSIQGHSVWHVMGAVSVVLLYTYYSSERSAFRHV